MPVCLSACLATCHGCLLCLPALSASHDCLPCLPAIPTCHVCLPACLSVCSSVSLSICLPIHHFVRLFIWLWCLSTLICFCSVLFCSVCLSFRLSVHLSVRPSDFLTSHDECTKCFDKCTSLPHFMKTLSL
jgi:hypothetical protein